MLVVRTGEMKKRKPMKILQVITSLYTGGAEKLISEIAPMLRDKGHQVDVLAFDGTETAFKKALTDKGIKVYSFGKGCNVYNPPFIYRLTKLMKNYDIVHTHNTAPQLFAAIGSVLCSVVLCTTEHTTSNRRRDWKWYAWIDKWMYSRYRKVICISDSTEQNLRDFIRDSSDKICTILNGINITRYSHAIPVDKSTISNHPERKVVAMVAGFRYQKDQETLIRAFKNLPEDYELWLVGDGERRAIIEQCIKDNQLEDRVVLLGIRSDIPSILKSVDLVVQSSHWEGFGLAAVEGMAAGKPVVASDVEGLAQVVEGAGLLFPLGDDKQLADIIKQLIENQTYYQQIASKCIERAQMFDIQKMVDAYNEVYEGLMPQKHNS